MSSTSQKHRDFVSEPMGEKDVAELAGIGTALGGRLVEKGFDKLRQAASYKIQDTDNIQTQLDSTVAYNSNIHTAYIVLGQFLMLKQKEECFCEWLKDACGANAKQQADCYNCLKQWCETFL